MFKANSTKIRNYQHNGLKIISLCFTENTVQELRHGSIANSWDHWGIKYLPNPHHHSSIIPHNSSLICSWDQCPNVPSEPCIRVMWTNLLKCKIFTFLLMNIINLEKKTFKLEIQTQWMKRRCYIVRSRLWSIFY